MPGSARLLRGANSLQVRQLGQIRIYHIDKEIFYWFWGLGFFRKMIWPPLLITRTCVYDCRQKDMPQPVNAQLVKILRGEIQLNSAFETCNSSFKFVSVEWCDWCCCLFEIFPCSHFTLTSYNKVNTSSSRICSVGIVIKPVRLSQQNFKDVWSCEIDVFRG